MPTPPLRYDPLKLWAVSGVEFRQEFKQAGIAKWQVQPCGWSRVFLFEMGDTEDDFRAEVKAELFSSWDDILILAGAERPPYPYGRDKLFALFLPEPLANLNATSPYVIKLGADRPCTITCKQLFHPMAEPR